MALKMLDDQKEQSYSSSDLLEFRLEIQNWLNKNKPSYPGFLLPQTFMEIGSEQVLDFLREWQYKLLSKTKSK